MEITSVKIRKFEKEGSRMKASASVTIDDCFAIHDIRIIDGTNGLFVAMPNKKLKAEDSKYLDIVHPLNQETRDMFTNKILKAYDEADTPEEIEE